MQPVAPEPDEPWIPDDSTFGARLALVRQHMGWTKAQAARAIGASESSWGNWERPASADRKPTRPQGYEDITAKIAAASNCNLGWLRGTGPGGATLSVTAREPHGEIAVQCVLPGFADRSHLTVVPSLVLGA